MDAETKDFFVGLTERKCPYLSIEDSDYCGLIWVCTIFGDMNKSYKKMCAGCAVERSAAKHDFN